MVGSLKFGFIVFPAYVGMNRTTDSGSNILFYVPRMCGDEPGLLKGEVALVHPYR